VPFSANSPNRAESTTSSRQKQRRLSQQSSQTRTFRSYLTLSKKEYRDWRDSVLRSVFSAELRRGVADSYRCESADSFDSDAKPSCFV